jgi:hypothetical protein
VSTRSYGRAFVRSLPPARRLSSLDALGRFFRAP